MKANILTQAGRTTTGRLVPYTLFTDPELGRIGITQTQADQQGLDYCMAQIPATEIPRAITSGETEGLLKVVIDNPTKQILGCSLLCHNAGEILAVIQMAMIGNLTYETVRDTIFSHPTMAESLNVMFGRL